MEKNYRLIIFGFFLLIACNSKRDCVYLESFFREDSFHFIYIKDEGRSSATYQKRVRSMNNDNIYVYKTNALWPGAVGLFLEKGDTLKKIKGENVLYIYKKDTILIYKDICGESYINDKPIREILIEKGIISG